MLPPIHETERQGVATCYAKDAQQWRSWLEANHQDTAAVWLIIYHKGSDRPSVTYPEAVDEALCFGWVDSKPNKRDNQSFYQYFAARNPKSNWSRVNKEKVERLTQSNRMTPAGLQMVAMAKETGTWDALDDVENLVIPADLQALLEGHPRAKAHFEAFPRSVKRGILEWIFNAKRAETRKKRIDETVKLAAENIRANQYRQ
ncbi:MAG: YdeI/OmpD-associated family protein [Bacteroidota bacterium]